MKKRLRGHTTLRMTYWATVLVAVIWIGVRVITGTDIENWERLGISLLLLSEAMGALAQFLLGLCDFIEERIR